MPILPIKDPTSIDFQQGQRTPRPLPPPGNPLDGRRSNDISALYPDTSQVTIISLAGSTSTDDKTTLVITPTLTAAGSPWADSIGPVSITHTTVASDQDIPAVTAGLIAGFAAAGTISDLADLANYQRIRDFVLVEAVEGEDQQIKLTGRVPGVRFTYSLTSVDDNGNPGSVTETSTTTGGVDDDLRVGVFAVRDGYTDRGVPKVAKPSASSTADDTLGVVMDSIVADPIKPGQLFKVIKRGRDVTIREAGACSVYGEKACAVGGKVYYRKVAAAGEIEGAVTDTATTDTPEVLTLTPTPADATLFKAELEVLDFFTGAKLAEGIIEMTSDADATATEICDGLRTSLADDNDQLDSYITGSGTTTLILTQAPGVIVKVSPTGPGVLAVAETTPAASDHVLVAGAKFDDSSAAAGPQAIYLPHP